MRNLIRSVLFFILVILLGSSTGVKAGDFYEVEALYEINIVHDISFAEGKDFDAYLPVATSKEQKFPAIVMIHGGGWVAGTKRQAREVRNGKVLASRGYVCVDIEYLIAKEDAPSWPQCLYDCKNAVKYLRKYADKYNVDADRIAVMGGSAGGHLALMTAFTGGNHRYKSGLYDEYSDDVSAVIDLYGITNTLKWRYKGGYMLLGHTKKGNEELWKEASPVFAVKSEMPAILIMHGTDDKTVGIEQSQELSDVLEQKGIEHELIVVEGAGHSFTFDSTPTNYWPVILEFLKDNLRNNNG
ncbi:MAG: prolyl oligopeptidase family serine peptidase [Sedimentisphaeraceae bacterium JB056]